jgi:hypothetical protein
MNRSVKLNKALHFYKYNPHVQTHIASITELQSSKAVESNARYDFYMNNAFTLGTWTTEIIYTDASGTRLHQIQKPALFVR